MNWIDLLFLVTVVVLVLNGLRNGALFSFINLLSLPIGFAVVTFFGPRFTAFLVSSGINVSPLVAYVILFFLTVLIVHVIGSALRGGVRSAPVVGSGDALLGAALGFVEAWAIWLVLLMALGWFLGSAQDAVAAGQSTVLGVALGIKLPMLQEWHDFYNQAVTASMFAKVNGFFISVLPGIKSLQPLS